MQRKPSHNQSVNNQTTASRKPCVRRQKLVVLSTLCQTKDPAKNGADRPEHHFSSQFHISANHPLPDQISGIKQGRPPSTPFPFANFRTRKKGDKAKG
jgi:hypothetical protein